MERAAFGSLVAKPGQDGILKRENVDLLSWEIDNQNLDSLLGPVMPVGSRKLDKSDRVWLDIHSWYHPIIFTFAGFSLLASSNNLHSASSG